MPFKINHYLIIIIISFFSCKKNDLSLQMNSKNKSDVTLKVLHKYYKNNEPGLKMIKELTHIDNNLGKYYKNSGRKDYYENDEYIGKFFKKIINEELLYPCVTIKSELSSPEDCMYNLFDDKFPRTLDYIDKKCIKNADNLHYIYYILKYCYEQITSKVKIKWQLLILDAVLGQYYKLIERDDYYVDGIGKFKKWFEENQYGIGKFKKWFEKNVFENCSFGDIDNDFPRTLDYIDKTCIKNVDNDHYIYHILKYCYKRIKSQVKIKWQLLILDAVLGQYYKLMERDDYYVDGIGKFKKWFEDNEYEEEDIQSELENLEDCNFNEFDDDFPINPDFIGNQTSIDEEKSRIIKYCFLNRKPPEIKNFITKIKENIFNELIKEYKKPYANLICTKFKEAIKCYNLENIGKIKEDIDKLWIKSGESKIINYIMNSLELKSTYHISKNKLNEKQIDNELKRIFIENLIRREIYSKKFNELDFSKIKEPTDDQFRYIVNLINKANYYTLIYTHPDYSKYAIDRNILLLKTLDFFYFNNNLINTILDMYYLYMIRNHIIEYKKIKKGNGFNDKYTNGFKMKDFTKAKCKNSPLIRIKLPPIKENLCSIIDYINDINFKRLPKPQLKPSLCQCIYDNINQISKIILSFYSFVYNLKSKIITQFDFYIIPQAVAESKKNPIYDDLEVHGSNYSKQKKETIYHQFGKSANHHISQHPIWDLEDIFNKANYKKNKDFWCKYSSGNYEEDIRSLYMQIFIKEKEESIFGLDDDNKEKENFEYNKKAKKRFVIIIDRRNPKNIKKQNMNYKEPKINKNEKNWPDKIYFFIPKERNFHSVDKFNQEVMLARSEHLETIPNPYKEEPDPFSLLDSANGYKFAFSFNIFPPYTKIYWYIAQGSARFKLNYLVDLFPRYFCKDNNSNNQIIDHSTLKLIKNCEKNYFEDEQSSLITYLFKNTTVIDGYIRMKIYKKITQNKFIPKDLIFLINKYLFDFSFSG